MAWNGTGGEVVGWDGIASLEQLSSPLYCYKALVTIQTNLHIQTTLHMHTHQHAVLPLPLQYCLVQYTETSYVTQQRAVMIVLPPPVY
jgi:hypothetical protein